MRPVQDVLNQIKWDEKLEKKDFVIEYLDFGKLVSVHYSDIKRVEDGFMVLMKSNEETFIPLHRIKVVKQKGEIIWQR